MCCNSVSKGQHLDFASPRIWLPFQEQEKKKDWIPGLIMNLQGNVFRELELTSEAKLFLATSYAEVGESISELYLARCKSAPAGLT